MKERKSSRYLLNMHFIRLCCLFKNTIFHKTFYVKLYKTNILIIYLIFAIKRAIHIRKILIGGQLKTERDFAAVKKRWHAKSKKLKIITKTTFVKYITEIKVLFHTFWLTLYILANFDFIIFRHIWCEFLLISFFIIFLKQVCPKDQKNISEWASLVIFSLFA